MKKVVKMNVELTVEERNLLSVAYKNVIGSRRASWRVISNRLRLEEEKEKNGEEAKVERIKSYKSKVEKELRDICDDILVLLKEHLIDAATVVEGKVFYNKM